MLRTLSPVVLGLLLIIPLMLAAGQVLFKITSLRLAESDMPPLRVLVDPAFVGALALYGVATVLWIHILKTTPLSFAYSFMALSFVFVPLLASLFLGETLGWRYLAGTGLIMAGLVVVQG